jgi:hypothetical protein
VLDARGHRPTGSIRRRRQCRRCNHRFTTYETIAGKRATLAERILAEKLREMADEIEAAQRSAAYHDKD